MTINLTTLFTWAHCPSCLRFYRTLFASSIMGLSLSACSENISESKPPATINLQDNASSQHAAAPRKAETNVVPHTASTSSHALKTMSQAVPMSSKVSWVLDGTDLLKMTEVNHSSGHPDTDWSGQYSSEQGGSLLNLHIESHGQGQWALSRKYSEPALKNNIKHYELYVTNEGLVSQSADLAIKKTEAGVLVFEASSGVSSIPASYWVHYLKHPK